MVKLRKENIKKKRFSKGFKAIDVEARKINASTQFDTCTERLSPFGGLLKVTLSRHLDHTESSDSKSVAQPLCTKWF